MKLSLEPTWRAATELLCRNGIPSAWRTYHPWRRNRFSIYEIALILLLCLRVLAAAARPSELHKSAPSLQAEQSDVIQPLGLGSQFAICQLDLTRDVKYSPWPCDRAGQSGLVPPERTVPGAVLFAHSSSQIRSATLFPCAHWRRAVGEFPLRVMGYDDSWVSYYSLSFVLVFKDKPSFLLPQPDFQVSDNVYITLLDGSSTCIMEQRLWHLKQTRKLWRGKIKDALESEFQQFFLFFFFALWKMLVHGAKNESMWQRGREEE